MMMPMNPLQAIQALQKGANPNQLMMQLAQNNPAVRQAVQMVNGKTPDQIRDMAQQVARQRGVDLNQFMQTLGIRL
ncbi:MAG: hypothetical protein J6L72_02295 [Butyricicoccus sp.]|nr:hypothetical protein [Butyricicoccus sp.]